MFRVWNIDARSAYLYFVLYFEGEFVRAIRDMRRCGNSLFILNVHCKWKMILMSCLRQAFGSPYFALNKIVTNSTREDKFAEAFMKTQSITRMCKCTHGLWF